MIDVRNRFVNQSTDSVLPEKIEGLRENPQHQCCFHPCVGHEPTVGEASMAEYTILSPVCGKQRKDVTVFLFPDDQRTIMESIGVIIHVAAQKQEGPILTSLNKL